MTAAEIVGGRSISTEDAKAAARIIGDVLKGGEADTVECRRALVDRSRPKDSPTHHLFEWDPKRQAEAYLMARAGEIIRSIRVVFEDKPDVPVRAFPVLLHRGQSGRVMAMEDVIKDRDLTTQLLREAEAEAVAWAKRYDMLRERAELSGVFKAIEKLQALAEKSKSTGKSKREKAA